MPNAARATPIVAMMVYRILFLRCCCARSGRSISIATLAPRNGSATRKCLKTRQRKLRGVRYGTRLFAGDSGRDFSRHGAGDESDAILPRKASEVRLDHAAREEGFARVVDRHIDDDRMAFRRDRCSTIDDRGDLVVRRK